MNARAWLVIVTMTAIPCSGCSSTSSASNGCEVSFTDVTAVDATILTTSFRDDSPSALFWNPKLKHLDVLGGDLSHKPSRAFELELFGNPIVDGATVMLGLPDPASPITPTSRLSFSGQGIEKMRSSGGTVHFATASNTRLVFNVTGATMVTLDANGQAKAGAPSLTISMTCAMDAKAE